MTLRLLYSVAKRPTTRGQLKNEFHKEICWVYGKINTLVNIFWNEV